MSTHFFFAMGGIAPETTSPDHAPLVCFAQSGAILYLFLLVLFSIAQGFIWVTCRNSKASSKNLILLMAIADLSTCGLIAGYEIWLKPAVNQFWSYALGSETLLPPLAQFIFRALPSGSCIAPWAILCAATHWSFLTQAAFRGQQLTPWLRLLLIVYTLTFLIAVPIAGFSPLLYI